MSHPQSHVPGALHDPTNPSGLTGAGHPDIESHGIGKYVVVFVALCILTGMSFFTYSRYWPFPDEAVKRTFMIAVSCTKALLVILFFMHVKYEANWKYVLTIPAGLMAIFLMLMLVPDVGMRNRRASEERQKHMALPAEEQAAIERSAEQPPTESPPALAPAH